ncbi:MAG TPA: type II secretion system secretin GspD [Tepidisphaeraceae bacterium]|nr:type II secretion system secretin GspD [Tepidisphaeraceae bacterium]
MTHSASSGTTGTIATTTTARARSPLAAALALAMASAPAVAQVAPTTAPAADATTAPSDIRNGNATTSPHITTQPSGSLVLNFKDASIDSVLDELSSAAGFIVVKEVKPEGRVTLISKQPVSPTEAISLLNTVLKNAGYAAIQQERILKIVRRDAAKRANIPVRSGADPSKIAMTDELITQVIPLRQADAMQLRQDLAPLISTEADFTANQSSNALVITDTSANIRRVVEIVSALDGHLADSASVLVKQLKYSTATNAARLVEELFGDQAQGGGRNQQEQPRFGGFFGAGGIPNFGSSRGGSTGGRNQQTENPRASVRVNASGDDRTNIVVVTGPPETLVVIDEVLQKLDANPAAEETVFVYKLKNAQALNVEHVVNVLFNGGASGSRGANRSTSGTGLGASNTRSNSRAGGTGPSGRGSTGGTGGFGGTGTQSRFGGTTGGTTGGLGGFGGGGFFGALSQAAQSSAMAIGEQVSVIADQDTNSLLVRTNPRNYEQVRAILDELDRPVAQVLIKVLIAEVTHDKNTDFGAEFSVLNLRPSGNGQVVGSDFNSPTNASGLTVGILEEHVAATIRALETDGKLDVLSRPYILASDNQLATITVGQEVPFITRSQLTDTGQTINTIEYDDIGILLDVVPHINPDGLVILDVAPEISALTGGSVPISETVSSPIFAKRSAQSRVGVQNGQTIVIGGLMEDRKTQTVDKIPFLGDIPIIGNAFKRTRMTKSKTELLIFLTPHVALRPDELKTMGEDELDGSKLVPSSVYPGAFQEHMRGLQRGASTRPTSDAPSEGIIIRPRTQEQ